MHQYRGGVISVLTGVKPLRIQKNHWLDWDCSLGVSAEERKKKVSGVSCLRSVSYSIGQQQGSAVYVNLSATFIQKHQQRVIKRLLFEV